MLCSADPLFCARNQVHAVSACMRVTAHIHKWMEACQQRDRQQRQQVLEVCRGQAAKFLQELQEEFSKATLSLVALCSGSSQVEIRDKDTDPEVCSVTMKLISTAACEVWRRFLHPYDFWPWQLLRLHRATMEERVNIATEFLEEDKENLCHTSQSIRDVFHEELARGFPSPDACPPVDLGRCCFAMEEAWLRIGWQTSS